MLIEMWFFLVVAQRAWVDGPTPATTVGPFADEIQCKAHQRRIEIEQKDTLQVILPCWRGQ
jgi:hypothetical protein